MAFLKYLLSFCLLALSLNTSAQYTNELKKAFSQSFELESENKFEDAASALLGQYSQTDYICNIRLGWLYYKAEKYKESARYYDTAVLLMPYAVEAKLGAVLPKAELNQWDAVIELYKDILRIDGKHGKALYNLGLIYYNRGYFVASYDLLKELNNLYPIDYSSMLMYAWASLKLGKVREAKVLFNKVLLLYPDDESATSGLKEID